MSEWRACLLTAQNQKRHISCPSGLFVPVSEVTWPTWTGRKAGAHLRTESPSLACEAYSPTLRGGVLTRAAPYLTHASATPCTQEFTRVCNNVYTVTSLSGSEPRAPAPPSPHDRLSSPLYTSTIILGLWLPMNLAPGPGSH